MKIFIYSVFILLHSSCQASEHHGYGYDIGYKKFHDSQDHGYGIHHGHGVHHDLHDYREISNQDQSNIYRPCLVNDMKCIYEFFKHNNMCLSPLSPSKPYIIKKSLIDIPQANSTFTIYNAELKGLQTGKVREFYINKKMDTLVFEVEFQSLFLDSPKSLATYYRRGKVPVEVTDFIVVDFKDISLTLTIRHIHDTNLQRNHVYAYLPDPNPPYTIGPRFGDSRALTNMKKKWLGYVQLSAIEAMVSQAPIYMSAYIRTQICSFMHQ